MDRPDCRLGIDVGGTNTDAALIDGNRVLAATKAPTSPDVSTGIAAAIASLQAASRFDPAGCAFHREPSDRRQGTGDKGTDRSSRG